MSDPLSQRGELRKLKILKRTEDVQCKMVHSLGCHNGDIHLRCQVEMVLEMSSRSDPSSQGQKERCAIIQISAVLVSCSDVVFVLFFSDVSV